MNLGTRGGRWLEKLPKISIGTVTVLVCLVILEWVLKNPAYGNPPLHSAERPSSDEVRLLKYPFPYQGAVTINSDIDDATVEKFDAVHTLVNGTSRIVPASEPWHLLFSDGVKERLAKEGGITGFGLPLADSFWLYNERIGVYKGFDYKRHRPIPHSHAGRDMRDIVDEWFRKGWLDTLHGPGTGDVRREAVAAGMDWLAQYAHRSTRIWSNHSTSHTPANIGPLNRNALDLIPKNLVKCCTAGLSMAGAHELAKSIAVSPYPEKYPPDQQVRGWALKILTVTSSVFLLVVMLVARFRRRSLVAGSLVLILFTISLLYLTPIRYGLGDNLDTRYYCADLARARGFTYYWLLHDTPEVRAHIPDVLRLPENNKFGRSSILNVWQLDDGTSVMIFSRCLKGSLGDRGLELFSPENLEDLCRHGGTAILYIHWTARVKENFTWAGLEGLRNLADWYRSGKVWVAPASAVLDFTFARTFLTYTVASTDERVVIRVSSIANPVGPAIAPTLANLRGISFDCPSGRPIVLELGGKEIPAASLRFSVAGSRTILQIPLETRGNDT